jgi:hypothetical protein
MSRRRFWLPFSFFVTLVPSPALASESFPDAIKTALAIPGPKPDCIICHDTEAGGAGTVNRAFGIKAKNYGLTSGDTIMLASVLAKMRDAKDDSDGDGMSDIDEIKVGRNPNINDLTGKSAEEYPPPVYGCQTSRSRDRMARGNGGMAMATAALLLVQWLRSRTPQRRYTRSLFARRADAIARQRSTVEKGRVRW